MHKNIPQTQMIHRIRKLADTDERVQAAMLYGSFALDEADQYSDIDCMLFIRDTHLESLDPLAWVSQVEPVLIYFVNEFGNHAVVYENFVRAEFHFDPVGKIPQMESFKGRVWFPSLERTILIDKTGELGLHLQALVGAPPERTSLHNVRYLNDSFCNWILFGCNVFARGETARAREILNLVQDNLLRMVRISAGSTQHWINPTRQLEKEIPKAAYHRFQRCVAGLSRSDLERAYLAAWRWGNQLLAELYARHDAEAPVDRMDLLGTHLKTLLDAAKKGQDTAD